MPGPKRLTDTVFFNNAAVAAEHALISYREIEQVAHLRDRSVAGVDRTGAIRVQPNVPGRVDNVAERMWRPEVPAFNSHRLGRPSKEWLILLERDICPADPHINTFFNVLGD